MLIILGSRNTIVYGGNSLGAFAGMSIIVISSHCPKYVIILQRISAGLAEFLFRASRHDKEKLQRTGNTEGQRVREFNIGGELVILLNTR